MNLFRHKQRAGGAVSRGWQADANEFQMISVVACYARNALCVPTF